MLPLFRSLRHIPFALLWSGQSVSSLGDRVFQVALAWWVLEKTGSAVAMGTVFVLTTVPMLVFLLVGGVLVDRYPRLPLLLLSDLLRGVVIGLAAWLALADLLTIWHVYAFSLIFGFVDAFFQPALRAVVPEIAPPEDLPSANSLTGLSSRVSGIIGPAVGAGIVAAGGTTLAFAVDSASFLISALFVVPILRLAVWPQGKAIASSVFGDLREGLAAVTSSAWLWVTIAVAGLSNIAIAGPMDVALPFLIKDVLQADVGVLGLFYSVSSLGSILAAAWLGRFVRLRRRGLMLYGTWMLIGLFVVAVGLPVGAPGILAASFFIGVCNSIVGLVWTNTLQELVPQRLLGRVTSVDYLGSYILIPPGYAIGGWATEALGPPMVFVAGGIVQAALVALGLLHPQVRNLD